MNKSEDDTTSKSRPAVGTGDIRPVPDPTVLTTAAILREMQSLREILEGRIDGHRDLFNARIDGMDKAITLLQVITDRQPADVDRKVESLQKLHEEKFGSIQVQFKERDVRTEQTSRDSKVAVDAALQAAKEAVGAQQASSATAIAKNETATAKQIDTLALLIQTGNKASDDKIADLKDRLNRIEGKSEGKTGVGQSLVAVASLIIAAIAVTAAIVFGVR